MAIGVADLKARLNITSNKDDAELIDMLEGAEAEFALRVGPLDNLQPNERELILADAAGIFASTQRGGGSMRPSFSGDGYDERQSLIMPLTLYPRIQAYALHKVRAIGVFPAPEPWP